jgi:hypothetical protein
VGGGYYCQNNNLITLEGAPIKMGEYDFNFESNNIRSLDFLPKFVYYYSDHNPIESIISLFIDHDSFKQSLDYGYLRGDSIDRRRLKEALEEADIEIPKRIKGWNLI